MPGKAAWNAGMSGATMRRPTPRGAVTTSAPARLQREGGDGGLGLLDRLEHALGGVVVGAADLGRGEPAGGAVEEADPEALLELLDAVRGDGGRQPVVAAAGGDRAELDGAGEDADAFEVGHGGASAAIFKRPLNLIADCGGFQAERFSASVAGATGRSRHGASSARAAAAVPVGAGGALGRGVLYLLRGRGDPDPRRDGGGHRPDGGRDAGGGRGRRGRRPPAAPDDAGLHRHPHPHAADAGDRLLGGAAPRLAEHLHLSRGGEVRRSGACRSASPGGSSTSCCAHGTTTAVAYCSVHPASADAYFAAAAEPATSG